MLLGIHQIHISALDFALFNYGLFSNFTGSADIIV